MNYLTPDEYGEGGTASYNVHSLYLDDTMWGLYRDTKVGLFERQKVRARCYQFTPDADVFLEVKHRAGEAMWKTRERVRRDVARQLLAGEWVEGLTSSPALENFRARMDRRDLRPAVWVTYRRHAYVGSGRDLVRVTFDSRIKSGLPTADLREPAVWHLLPEVASVDIVELKYTGSYPAWLGDMIRRFHLARWSMSKYKQGVEVLYGTDSPGPVPRLEYGLSP